MPNKHNNQTNAIEVTRLKEHTTSCGKTVLHGVFGFSNARVQIIELEEPDQYGCTWALNILPARKNKQMSTGGTANVGANGELLGYSAEPETQGEAQ